MADAMLECDIVMRGGVTSGIVYPGLIAELAKTYRFRSIGGTSAGAIAAAVTAAASFGRDTGSYRNGDPFEAVVAPLPKALGEPVGSGTRLESLFQPSRETRPIWRVVKPMLARKEGQKASTIAFAAVAGMIRSFPASAVLAAVIAYAAAAILSGSLSLGLGRADLPAWLQVVIFVLWLAVIALAAVLGAALRTALSAFGILKSGNNFGLCPGFDPESSGPPALTGWLHELIQTAAGRTVDAPPLTFGDLWQNGLDAKAERAIELVLLTTNITRGTAHRAPFLAGAFGALFYKEAEWRKLFPPRVLQHLRDARPKDAESRPLSEADCLQLPDPACLPILVGARLSLSFPLLLQAVPLWGAESGDGKRLNLRRVWFSDGGLTSNFPINLFDAVLPTRPTFGINLAGVDTEVVETATTDENGDGEGPAQFVAEPVPSRRGPIQQGKDWSRIYMPDDNSQGVGQVAKFNTVDGKGVLGFLLAAFDAARNWVDTASMVQPGYRDRIVTIKLAPEEGGMNLGMPPPVIDKAGKLGPLAGELLAARFSPVPVPDPKTGEEIRLNWDNHRWVRYRSAMAGLEAVLRRFGKAWTQPAPGRTFHDLVRRGDDEPPRSYRFGTVAQQKFAERVSATVSTMATGWESPDETFDRREKSSSGRSPRPKLALRLVPVVENDPRTDRPWDTSPDADGPGPMIA